MDEPWICPNSRLLIVPNTTTIDLRDAEEDGCTMSGDTPSTKEALPAKTSTPTKTAYVEGVILIYLDAFCLKGTTLGLVWCERAREKARKKEIRREKGSAR